MNMEILEADAIISSKEEFRELERAIHEKIKDDSKFSMFYSFSTIAINILNLEPPQIEMASLQHAYYSVEYRLQPLWLPHCMIPTQHDWGHSIHYSRSAK